MDSLSRTHLKRHLDRARSAVGLNWPDDVTRERLQDLANELARNGIEANGFIVPPRLDTPSRTGR